jgi:hypothetical protein
VSTEVSAGHVAKPWTTARSVRPSVGAHPGNIGGCYIGGFFRKHRRSPLAGVSDQAFADQDAEERPRATKKDNSYSASEVQCEVKAMD